MYNRLTEKDGYILVDGWDISEKLTIYDDNGFIEWDYYGLVSSLCNENQGEVRYIKELVSRKIDCNFPLLVCDCDCDFNCTVAVVKVRFCDDCVKWEKIGIVEWDKKTFLRITETAVSDVLRTGRTRTGRNMAILRMTCFRTTIFSMTGAVKTGRRSYIGDAGDIITNILTMTTILTGQANLTINFNLMNIRNFFVENLYEKTV